MKFCLTIRLCCTTPHLKAKYWSLTKPYFVHDSHTAIILRQHTGVKYAKGVADFAGLSASEGLPVFLEAFIFYSFLIFLKPKVNRNHNFFNI